MAFLVFRLQKFKRNKNDDSKMCQSNALWVVKNPNLVKNYYLSITNMGKGRTCIKVVTIE